MKKAGSVFLAIIILSTPTFVFARNDINQTALIMDVQIQQKGFRVVGKIPTMYAITSTKMGS